MIITAPSICIKDTGTGTGLGAFALRAYQRHEIIEVCSVIAFNMPADVMPVQLRTRVFNWKILAKMEFAHAIALGFGGLYNHRNPANMRYDAIGAGCFLQFTAVRDIETGEELTINYNGLGGAHESVDNNWFERMGVQPIIDGA
jgi:hypothetical protein